MVRRGFAPTALRIRRRLHHRAAAGGVVGGAGGIGMRVEVRAEQHDLPDARSVPGISAMMLDPFGVFSS